MSSPGWGVRPFGCAGAPVRPYHGSPPSVALGPGQSSKLQQVLLNLVVNALEAMRETPTAERRVIIRGDREPDRPRARFWSRAAHRRATAGFRTGLFHQA